MKLRLVLLLMGVLCVHVAGQELPGDQMLSNYFRVETSRLADACLTDLSTREHWEKRRVEYRQQLFDMLGLNPLPPKADLKAAITGRIERDDFVVEKLHFQSMPGLYVTANLYLPKTVDKPVPTILYLSGHARMVTNGVSMGNKTGYQHHGIWFARNGYACLVMDTLQLGEIEGIHHGTYNKGMWWWNSRGYTPAGVEAWNNIRALDYLETRPEVDRERIGVTGRSGGGAYSWVITALDDRIKVAAPVAGITDLENHVVDGVIEGHCDCMFHVNTYRWDYPLVAALAAPRPLLFCNSDKDTIFPLEGIVRTHAKVREVYRLYNKTDHLGLLITEGPHKDTQDLQVPVFRWFNRFLKGEDPLISMAAEKLFDPAELKVFKTLPTDSINARIHETFVPAAPASLAPNSEPGAARDALIRSLREKVFAGWPTDESPAVAKKIFETTKEGITFSACDFETQEQVTLRLYCLRQAGGTVKLVRFNVLNEPEWKRWVAAVGSQFPDELKREASLANALPQPSAFVPLRDMLASGETALVFFAPRGIGLTAWDSTPKKQTHNRRRFMLLGQTLDGMRVWDIRKALSVLPALQEGRGPVSAAADGDMASNLLYAALFEDRISELTLSNLPESHRQGPDYLNVLRVADIPQVLQLVKTKIPVTVSSKQN